ncbi:MAG: hypothetical protein AUK44_00250 [Porphyromonadaceae bacterium CG2_30_38_12]|nr:MAG: hypothetical protein AUK44_00250 [Porphyromonadaceae bacterium CG2_30_38_12]
MRFFDISYIACTLWSYPLSYIELAGTLVGIVAVWLAIKQKNITWLLGLINVSLFFLLFYQVRLYANMLLQVFFFITNIYGWYSWHKQNETHQKPIVLTTYMRWRLSVGIVLTSLLTGYCAQRIHIYLPQIFDKPASQPYPDAFIAIASMVGQILLTRRITDNWYVWIAVNFVSTIVFFKQGIYLVAFEYLLFLLLALKGSWDWHHSKQTSK